MTANQVHAQIPHSLGLRAGDWVEVRSVTEILATLSGRGSLEALPFMPEMVKYCGKRFRVFKSAHKACDTIKHRTTRLRRMNDAVHLEGLRCDGEAHGGCQARCLIYWKESWLKRVSGPVGESDPARRTPDGVDGAGKSSVTLADLARATRHPSTEGPSTEERFSCQATTLREATTSLRTWDAGQYVKDITSRNVRPLDLVRFMLLAAYNAVMRLHWRGRPYPYLRGLAGKKTPTVLLNLQPGELVRVRPKDEIIRTINENNRNRGLSLDVEMLPFCGRTFRVLARVEKIIDETTGTMLPMQSACIILENVTCSGNLSAGRVFCPRNIYPYWREVWLERVP